ncbi:MAG: hypothetical protein ABIR32_04115 [Ilumatobacteraceae bacterium]
MTNRHGTEDHGPVDGDRDRDRDRDEDSKIDSIARAAGAALRQPAPADGVDRLQSAHRRRQTVRAAAAGAVVAAVAIALFVVVGRNSDGHGVVVTPPPGSVDVTLTSDAPPISGAPTDSTVASDPTTTTSEPTPTTVAAETTTSSQPIAELTWAAATESFPALSYIACCGTDWEGEPSPPVPADPAVALAEGIYNAQTPRSDGIRSDDDVDDGVLTLEIRSYGRCSDGVVRCSGDEPYPANALGTTDEPSRLIDVVLDDTVRVAVTGFGCNGAADQLFDVREVGTGSDLLALYQQLGDAYEIAVGGPLRNGVAPEQIASDITANMTGGFFDPGCPTWTSFAWDPVAGPSILAPLNLFTVDGQPPLQPNDGIELESIYPTAVSVDGAGVMTVYFYAGFLS